jgi:hypothetical protein
MSQQFHIFQENLLGLFLLCKDLVQIFQGSLTLVGHPVFNNIGALFESSRQFYIYQGGGIAGSWVKYRAKLHARSVIITLFP